MAYTFDEFLLSDFYKDAYGTRSAMAMWPNEGSDDEKQAAWDSLLIALEESVDAEKKAAKAAKESFEATIAKNLTIGAVNRGQALRWALDTHCRDLTCAFELDSAIYALDLSFADGQEYIKELWN